MPRVAEEVEPLVEVVGVELLAHGRLVDDAELYDACDHLAYRGHPGLLPGTVERGASRPPHCSAMYHILLPIALLTGGLAAGALMVSALGGAPMLLSLPVASYVPVHKFLVTRFDPFIPICLVTA